MVVFVITIALTFHYFINYPSNRTIKPPYSQSSILPIAAPVLLFGGYALVTDKLVSECVNKAPRDPATGILHGAEPQDFGPADTAGAALLIHGFLGAGNNFNELPETWVKITKPVVRWDYERERAYKEIERFLGRLADLIIEKMFGYNSEN